MIRALKEKMAASMGMKLVAAITGVIFVLMLLGTVFVARMIMEGQYRNIETRGRELGVFLGKAGTDPILYKDMITIDALASEAVKSPDILYTLVMDASGTILNTVTAGFNRDNPDVKAILAKEKSDDVAAIANKVKLQMDVLEVAVDIAVGGTKFGTVKMGFSREGAKKSARNIALLLLGTSGGIVLVLAAIVYAMTRRMVVSPVSEAVAVASNIAEGDLTQAVKVKSTDELGMIGRGLNRMIIGLKSLIVSVQDAALHVDSASGQVKDIAGKIMSGGRVQAEAVEEAASSVNEMHFSLKEIGANVQDLYTTSEHTASSVLEMGASIDEVAGTMSELSSSIEQTSTAITQMSAAVRQIAENVETLSSAAEETAASASQISASVREVESNARQSAALAESVAADAQQLGMRSIEKTIEGMGRIEGAARRAAEVVNRLGERAESIGGILTVIEDITDQTGLLALNASILAAQAGEHGKGFAVVAAEIRELANRTASSTQEIGKLITSVQEESREAVEAMKEGIVSVDQGARLARDAGEALKTILARASQSRDMSRSISKASAEQAKGVKQVSEAVDRINEMTHQIAKATNEQRSGSDQIIRASEKMREITRFVKSATVEQAKGSKDITAAVENMNKKVGMMNRAAGEVQTGSDLIVKAVERIKIIARENGEHASGLNATVDVLTAQAGSLKKTMEKFRT